MSPMLGMQHSPGPGVYYPKNPSTDAKSVSGLPCLSMQLSLDDFKVFALSFVLLLPARQHHDVFELSARLSRSFSMCALYRRVRSVPTHSGYDPSTSQTCPLGSVRVPNQHPGRTALRHPLRSECTPTTIV